MMTTRLEKRSATRWDALVDGELVGHVDAIGIVERRWTARDGADLTTREVDERGLIVTRTRRLRCSRLDGTILAPAQPRTLAACRESFTKEVQ
jgi:hypothetical protein